MLKSCMPCRILASETVQRQTTKNNVLASAFYSHSNNRDHFGDQIKKVKCVRAPG